MHPLRSKADSPAADFLSARPNRRWSVRQKIHAPAYVSVVPCEDGTIFGLNEVFDIGAEGLSFQNSEPLEPGSRVRLNLELSGRSAPVRATGRVIWSDLAGRTGVQLRRSSLSPPGQLEEYLFLNAITACAQYDASQSKASAEPKPAGQPQNHTADSAGEGFPGYAAMLACLTEIGMEAEQAELALDFRLQRLAERVLQFLRASGVAIALAGKVEKDAKENPEKEIVGRACAGSAPPVGTPFQSGAGFSGECIRSGLLMHCDDTETDSRVDHAACEAHDIRSIMAAPIRSDASVIGLIEVFSAQPKAFNRNVRVFLQHLAEIIAAIQVGAADIATNSAPASSAETALEGSSEEARFGVPEPIVLAPLDVPEDTSPFRLRRILVLAAAAALLLAVTLLMPWMRTKAKTKAGSTPALLPQEALQQAALKISAPMTEFEQLRQLAGSGDANAQFALGARYATGDGVPQDYATAAHWFTLAADQGHVVAQATLGAYYWAGRGVPEDLHKAYFWSVLAQAGGDEGSKFRLATLASRMSHQEVVQAQEEANEWLDQYQSSAHPHP